MFFNQWLKSIFLCLPLTIWRRRLRIWKWHAQPETLRFVAFRLGSVPPWSHPKTPEPTTATASGGSTEGSLSFRFGSRLKTDKTCFFISAEAENQIVRVSRKDVNRRSRTGSNQLEHFTLKSLETRPCCILHLRFRRHLLDQVRENQVNR